MGNELFFETKYTSSDISLVNWLVFIISVEKFLLSNFERVSCFTSNHILLQMFYEMWSEAEYGTISKFDIKNLSRVISTNFKISFLEPHLWTNDCILMVKLRIYSFLFNTKLILILDRQSTPFAKFLPYHLSCLQQFLQAGCTHNLRIMSKVSCFLHNAIVACPYPVVPECKISE